MIKICSLDFLNRENFETDVMTADGQILFNSDDKITPGIILKLYFKDIYVDESFLEEKTEAALENIEVSVAAVSNEAELESSPLNGPRFVDAGDVKEETVLGPRFIDASFIKEEETGSSGPRFVETNIVEEKTVSSGPRSIETNPVEGKTVSSGPRSIETTAEEEKAASSEPSLAEANYIKDDENKKEQKLSTKNSFEDEEVVIPKNPEDEPLVFDEETAKSIVIHSLKIGKMLKFSDIELKELEQVAYYYNIGITDFKKADLLKKGFRKRKVFASYEKLLNNGVVPEHIAEMVKFCANNYESESFALNSKIPYYHIVSLTSFYEESLAQNNSKQATLFKILQMGGNQFNIFILHKFIKIMRETND